MLWNRLYFIVLLLECDARPAVFILQQAWVCGLLHGVLMTASIGDDSGVFIFPAPSGHGEYGSTRDSLSEVQP